MRQKRSVFWSIILPLLCGFLGVALALWILPQTPLARLTAPAPPAPPDSIAQSPMPDVQDFEKPFIYAARVASPAVVHVRTYSVIESRSPYSGSIIEFFFGPQPPIRTPVSTTGSGVIVTNDGYIITNNHVIKGAAKIEICLDNKAIHPATLVATNPAIDLALLKIATPEPLPAIRFGNADSLHIGNWVLAIGNPFDLETTVTAGIVSATARELQLQGGRAPIESFIQVDAAVNPGNSGGALVNLRGELVGINTAIASPTGTFAGYAFSIPESTVREFIDSNIHQPIPQGLDLGLHLAPLTPRLAKQLTNGNLKGVFIAQIDPESPAQQAGIRAGDVLLGIGNTPTNTPEQAQRAIAKARPNRPMRLYIMRDGRNITCTMTLQPQQAE